MTNKMKNDKPMCCNRRLLPSFYLRHFLIKTTTNHKHFHWHAIQIYRNFLARLHYNWVLVAQCHFSLSNSIHHFFFLITDFSSHLSSALSKRTDQIIKLNSASKSEIMQSVQQITYISISFEYSITFVNFFQHSYCYFYSLACALPIVLVFLCNFFLGNDRHP